MLDASAFEPAPPPETAPPPAPKKRRGKPLSEQSHPAMVLLSHFCAGWQSLNGIPYAPNWGRDVKLAKKMLETHPIERLKAMVDLYFKTKDKFIIEAAFSFPLFFSNMNKLAAQAFRASRGRSGYRVSNNIAVGTRKLIRDLKSEIVEDVWDGEKWVEERTPKKSEPVPEKPMMDKGEEFE